MKELMFAQNNIEKAKATVLFNMYLGVLALDPCKLTHLRRDGKAAVGPSEALPQKVKGLFNNDAIVEEFKSIVACYEDEIMTASCKKDDFYPCIIFRLKLKSGEGPDVR
jgi:hypothetical protein